MSQLAPTPPGLASWPTLLRSFGTLAVGEAAARLLGLVSVIVMARQLETGSFGIVMLGLALVTWFKLVVDGGTEAMGLRDIARKPERFAKIVEPILGLRLALSVGAAVAFSVAVHFVASEPSDRAVLSLFALQLPVVALNLRWMVLGVRSSRAVAIGNIAAELLVAVGVVLFVNDKHDGDLIPLLRTAGELLYGGVVLGAVWSRFGLLRPRVQLAGWARTLKASLPLMATNAGRAVVYSADMFLIAVVLTRRDVGLYAAAYRPILFLSGLAGLFSTSFLASYSPAEPGRALSLFRRGTLGSAAVSIPIAFALSAAAGLMVRLVFGDGYSHAVASLAILSWSIPLLAISVPCNNALIAAGQQAALMRNSLIVAAANIGANLVVIPLAGIEGAASTTVLSFGIALVLNYRSAVNLAAAPPIGAVLARPAFLASDP